MTSSIIRESLGSLFGLGIICAAVYGFVRLVDRFRYRTGFGDEDKDIWTDERAKRVRQIINKKPVPPHAPGRAKEISSAGRKEAKYFKRKSILTKTELGFYNALEANVRNRYRVFAQPVLYSLILPERDGRVGYSDFSRIKSKSVDFVLCDPHTLEPKIVIEQDDYTHRYRKRRERDVFVRRILEEAGIRLFSYSSGLSKVARVECGRRSVLV